MNQIKLLAPNYCICQYDGCVCVDEERAIRFVMDGGAALNNEQREECIAEIESVEGYSRQDCENLSDSDLARMVLNAWTDYARDKGLL